MTNKTRDTSYAELLDHVSLPFSNGGEARIEKLLLKRTNTIEIRFSWWKHGRLIPRPLDCTEHFLWQLISKAIQQGVLCGPTKTQSRTSTLGCSPEARP